MKLGDEQKQALFEAYTKAKSDGDFIETDTAQIKARANRKRNRIYPRVGKPIF